MGAGHRGDTADPTGSALSVHLIPAGTGWLRLKHGALILLAPGPAQQRPFAGAELRIDPDITRATLPDSPTRRTGQYVRIRARAEAVYLAFRFGDLIPY